MMRKHRGILALMSLALLGAASAAAGWMIVGDRLPDPATADRDGLLRWMVTRDLSTEPRTVHRQLIARLERELRSGVNLDEVDAAIDGDARERFWNNADLLLAQWFAALADDYAAVTAERKSAFIDEHIDDVLRWKTVVALRARIRGQDASGDARLLELCQRRVVRWAGRADSRSAARMTALADDVRANIAGRYLRELFAAPQNDDAAAAR